MTNEANEPIPCATGAGDGNKSFKAAENAYARRKSSSAFGAEQRRIVRANHREFNAQFSYADNYIKTCKYNILTFLPLNLWEQFRRLANFYFLVLMCLQFIPQISSVVWYSTAIPLLFVLFVSAVKDGYDDMQRHKSDNQVNNRVSYIVRNGRLEEEQWMNVKVGDIVRMENEHFIAADLLLLSSSEPYGLCYVETAELDGETNLKCRCALPETSEMGDIVADIAAFDGEIHCEPPNNRLHAFEGRLVYKGHEYALDNSRMLLRGCRLRNTRWCYGLVVFAGRDTKLMMNSGKTTLKRTSLDRFLNVLILGIVLFLFAMCFICMILSFTWEHVTGRSFTVYLEWDAFIYQGGERDSLVIGFLAFLQFFSYIILLNTVVPISLYISVEVLRFCHSLWINFDRKMYYEKTDTAAHARTTTLNEELGQVQYIFSDKTGTLTQNIMVFKKCSINGRSYGDLLNARNEIVDIDENTPSVDFSSNRWYEPNFHFYDQTLLDDTKIGVFEVNEFWRLLAICHTVMPERKSGNLLEYQAQSPDEAALTSAARNFGFVFKSRTPRSITIEVNGYQEVYEVLHILDFDNVRKRMSVIVRAMSKEENGGESATNDATIKLYCKGADTMIFERLANTSTSELLKQATMQHLDKFASDGLRTLCVAYKIIEPEYCWQWMERQRKATLDVANKSRLLDELYEEIEQDMTLLGATAIEDKLQDGVPQTISTLAEANIKLWVLTGDKTETAINIGYSCRLLTEEMREVFVIDGESEREIEVQMKDIRRRIERVNRASSGAGGGTDSCCNGRTSATTPLDTKEEKVPISVISDAILENGFDHAHDGDIRSSPTAMTSTVSSSSTDTFALVINGSSLVHALNRRYEKLFLEIACLCTSVICCRVTPLQKAKVVDLVKRHVKAVTLAIGDGANDVSMIKTAHIGVGISGQEGMQAVLASDFSIGQFRYLERLLLVHGRWSYLRMSKFLRYFFYKNFSYTLTHFWYSFFCGYSAQTIYDPVLMACFNMFFTALPVLAMGIFDQDVNDEYSLRYPRLYIPGQNNMFFNMRIFVYSVIHGGISSIVLFFVPYGTYSNTTDAFGRDLGDYTLLSFTVFTSLVVVVTGQIMFDTAYWTLYNHLCVWGSLLLYVLIVVLIYQVAPLLPFKLTTSTTIAFYDVVRRAIGLPSFWMALLLICVVLLVPVLANRFFWFDTRPSYADRLRVLYKLYPHDKRPRPDERSGTAYSKQSIVPPTHRSRRGSFRSGYAFSHASGFGELIAKGTLFRNLEHLRMPSFKSSDSPKSATSKVLKSKRNGKPAMTSQLSPLAENLERTDAPLSSPQSKPNGLLLSLKHSIRPAHNMAATTTTFPVAKRNDDDSATTSVRDVEQKSSKQQGHEKKPKQQQKPTLASLQLTPRMSDRHRLLVNVDSEPLPTDWSLTDDSKLIDLEHSPHAGRRRRRVVDSTTDSQTSSATDTGSKPVSLPSRMTADRSSNDDHNSVASSSQNGRPDWPPTTTISRDKRASDVMSDMPQPHKTKTTSKTEPSHLKPRPPSYRTFMRQRNSRQRQIGTPESNVGVSPGISLTSQTTQLPPVANANDSKAMIHSDVISSSTADHMTMIRCETRSAAAQSSDIPQSAKPSGTTAIFRPPKVSPIFDDAASGQHLPHRSGLKKLTNPMKF